MRASELRNRAMTAAEIARANGFFATAEAFILIAAECYDGINDVGSDKMDQVMTNAPSGPRAFVTSIPPS